MTARLAAGAAQVDQFRADVLAGLSRRRKRVPAKYFYDAAGSGLFDEITRLDEYYLTRTELAIMRRYAAEMADRLGPQCLLIELGSGSLVKVRLLLDRLKSPAAYVPVDVSGDHLHRSAARLRRHYPDLAVMPVLADFTRDFPIPRPARPPVRRAVYFPGSTIGNFDPDDAAHLLRRIAGLVGRGGGLLLGVDLQKDPAVLEAAYNDSRGTTAEFNLNLLARINRELGADFDLTAFRHCAFYNRQRGRIEMQLVSTIAQQVRLAGTVVSFRAGESIHTENSYKHDLGDLQRQAADCGFRVDASWTDELQYFGVLYLTVPA
ncbi:MAG: L-histidine N(alpha)-methyltransferase [Pirellulales bacterium]